MRENIDLKKKGIDSTTLRQPKKKYDYAGVWCPLHSGRPTNKSDTDLFDRLCD